MSPVLVWKKHCRRIRFHYLFMPQISLANMLIGVYVLKTQLKRCVMICWINKRAAVFRPKWNSWYLTRIAENAPTRDYEQHNSANISIYSLERNMFCAILDIVRKLIFHNSKNTCKLKIIRSFSLSIRWCAVYTPISTTKTLPLR